MLARSGSDRRIFGELYRRATIVLVFGGFIVSFWACSIGPEVANWIYGPAFAPMADSLRLFCFALPVLFWVQIMTTTLMVLRGQSYLALISVINLATTTVLNILLIPGWGYLGATLANVLTEAFGLALHVRYLRKTSNIEVFPRGSWAVSVVGLIVLLLAFTFPTMDVLIASLGTAGLLVCGFLTNFIDDQDWALVRASVGLR
jgi:O-antigen/teichoic acid export membrane protein